jgi:hypothetical protein
MSDVNLNFTVAPVEATLVVNTNAIVFNPEPINLTMYAGGAMLPPAGNTAEVQYNASGVLGAISTMTTNGTVTTFNEVGNVKIGGGTTGQIIQTDGFGNLSWAAYISGSPPGGNATNIQYNTGNGFGGSANYTYSASTDTVTSTNNTVLGNLTMQRAMEKVSNTGFTTTLQFNALSQSIINYTTDCSANFTVNFRGDATTSLNTLMAIDQCMTFAIIVRNGTGNYFLTSVIIDGVTRTVRWTGGAPITGFTNSTEMYNFNIIKTASGVYTVLGSRGVYS